MNRRHVTALLTAGLLVSCGSSTPEAAREPSPSPSPSLSPPVPVVPSFPTATAPDGHGEFTVSVTTDADGYGEAETVTAIVEVCNQGPATTTEGGGGSDIPFSFHIVDERGDVVADDSHAVRTSELRMVQWDEQECREAQLSWNQHHWNRPEDRPSEPPEVYGTPQEGALVPPGAYRIRVTSSFGTATSEPFEVRRTE